MTDLGPRLQAIAAQHGALTLLLKHVEYSISQYELLLHQFAWDYHHIQTLYPPSQLVGFGLGQSVEDVADFTRYLRGLNLGPDERTLSDRLTLAQNAYAHILEYVRPVVPGSPSDQQVLLPLSQPQASSSTQQIPSLLSQPQVSSSTQPRTGSPAAIHSSPAVGTSPIAGRSSVIPSASEPSRADPSSSAGVQESGGRPG